MYFSFRFKKLFQDISVEFFVLRCVHARKSTEIYAINMYVICVCVCVYECIILKISCGSSFCVFRRKLVHISLNVLS